jgi:capsular polysaccharide biosynthesis protein
MVYLHASADTPEQARLIAQGGIAMLQQKGLQYWNRADSTSLDVSPLDVPPQAHPTKSRASLAVNPLLRTALALILAIGLAFLRHYLDQSIHQRGEVESLGFEVLGAIPRDGLHRSQP